MTTHRGNGLHSALSRVDGLAYRDVGAALGCSEGAVKALLFRATQSLKKTLKEYM